MRHSSDYERPAIFFAGIVVGMFFLGILISLKVYGLYAVSRDQGGTFAAIATLSAIFIAWRVHIGQIRDNIAREEHARKRKANSLRAHMNNAIIQLMRYTERSFSYIQQPVLIGAPPQPHNESVGLLSNVIEYADDITSESLKQIVSSIQVFASRMESGRNTQDELERTLLSLHLQLENMFHYARHDTENLVLAERNLESLHAALRSITRHHNPQYGPDFQATFGRLMQYYRNIDRHNLGSSD